MHRLDYHDAIKQVTSSYHTALQTVSVLIRIVEMQPQYLPANDLALPELRALPNELHDVYFMRMFASFDSSLRHYWRTTIRNSQPSTLQLLSSIAARRGVPQDTLDSVQEIRRFRNFLIHEEHQIKTRFTIAEASRHLNTFLARLPLQW